MEKRAAVRLTGLLLALFALAALSGGAPPAGLAAASAAPAAAFVGPPAAAPAGAAATRAASNSRRDWWFNARGAHRRPGIPGPAAHLLRQYHGLWIGGRHGKVVYLTFDEADESGTTGRIISILDRAHVKASFFLTGRYIVAHRGMTRRLVAHGFLVCNHSYSHPSMVEKAGSRRAFAAEITATGRAFHAATGARIAPFFRPPNGIYSARTLQLTRELGYTTVFWSFAHYDYDAGAQPPVSVTLHRIVSAAAPGVIYLLHASSRSNVGALAQAVHTLKRQGYRFSTLDQIQ